MATATFAAGPALAVMAPEQYREESKLMRVPGKLAGRRVAHVGKKGAALLARSVNCAEEVACAHVLSRRTRTRRKHLGWLQR